MHEFERWPDYNEQNWQQRFVTLDAKCKERGDAVIEAAYAHANEISTLQANLDKALEGLARLLPYTQAEYLAEAAQVRLGKVHRDPINKARIKAQSIIKKLRS